jgi:hypothetical protein
MVHFHFFPLLLTYYETFAMQSQLLHPPVERDISRGAPRRVVSQKWMGLE